MAHTKTQSTPVPDVSTPFVCDVCGETFETRRDLRRHGRAAGIID
jgi:hypothetical protein